MISYSDKARKAVAFLFQKYNDIDIYIEDTANRAMFEILLQRMIGADTKIHRIHQLGGRTAVIEECKKDQGKGRRRLYIIDGDLDLLSGEPAPKLKHFIRLSVYCSENLLITEESLTELAFECALNEEKGVLRGKVDFGAHMTMLERAFLPLFVLYAIAHKLQIGVPTVAYKVHRLLDKSNDCLPSASKVRARMRDLRRTIIKKVGRQQYLVTRNEIVTRFRASKVASHKVVSGKDYLLPLFHAKARTLFKLKDSVEHVKPRLARYTDLDVDSVLLAAVRGA